jgi:hypothetical protein
MDLGALAWVERSNKMGGLCRKLSLSWHAKACWADAVITTEFDIISIRRHLLTYSIVRAFVVLKNAPKYCLKGKLMG